MKLSIRRLPALPIFLLSVFGLTSCVLSFDVDMSDVDMEISFTLDDSCATSLETIQIDADSPYSKSFLANLSKTKKQYWVNVPSGRIPMRVKLDSFQSYHASVSRDWGRDLALTASRCGEADYKPMLIDSHMEMSGMISIVPECRWFTKIALYENVGGGSLIPIYPPSNLPEAWKTEINLIEHRTVFYLKELSGIVPTLRLELTDARGKVHSFSILPDLTASPLVEIEVTCDGETAEVFATLLSAGGGSPTEGDGDLDGEDETIDTETADGDSDDRPDGDGELESEEDQEAMDTADEPAEEDGATEEDQDLDSAEPEIEEEEEEPCGTERPTSDPAPIEAEGVAYAGEPSPGTETMPNNESVQYVLLPATETGAYMTFPFEIAQEWLYRVRLEFVGGDEFGIVSVYMDDSTTPLRRQSPPYSETFDLRVQSIPAFEYPAVEYKPVCLSEGAHTLKIVVTGTNGSGYKAGLERILLNTY